MEKFLVEKGFGRIRKEDLPRLKEYYYKMKENYASSINLVSVYAWDKNLPAFYKEAAGFLLFIVYDKINFRWVCLPPIGDYEKEELKTVFEELKLLFEEAGTDFVFTDVTPWMLPYFEQFFFQKMEITDAEELREYIYSCEEFREKLFQSRERYNYNYFLKKNKIQVTELSEDLKEVCKKLLKESFCSCHLCEECEYGCLEDTLESVLEVVENLEIHGFLILAEDTPIAYNIVSKEKDQLVFHFKKNQRGFRGMNEFIHTETLERYGDGCSTINYTEDMGVEGLRSYKSNLCNFTHQSKLEIRVR